MRALLQLAFSLLLASPASSQLAGTPGKVTPLPVASRDSLEDHQARAHVFAHPDWFQWGGSVVQGEDGRYHMFYARWHRLNERGMRGWLYESQIARATSARPEGPFQHEEVVLEGFGDLNGTRWDALNAHNPCITRMTDPASGKQRYYLYFIANRDDDLTPDQPWREDWWDHVVRQRIGVAVADSLNGPWVRHPQPIIEPPNGPLRQYLVNPGVCQLPDGRFLLVLKARKDETRQGSMVHGWALADRPEGPFVAQDSLLFPAEMRAEDPCVWVEGEWVYAAVKDWNGHVSGTKGISYVRGRLKGDSIDWQIPADNNISPRHLTWSDGQKTNVAHLERPFVLRDGNGTPTHLFAACSVLNPFADAHAEPSLHLPFNVCLPLALAKPPKVVKKPNVLILYADDLGFGDLGCYNPDSKIPTPNLDQLAAEGMRFTDGHSSSGICTPSRYALLTGRYHWRDFHGIVGPMGGSVFAPERLTMAEMLRDAGYHTAAIGKWHLGFGWDQIKTEDAYDWNAAIPDGPLAHGFDTYFGDAVINFPPYAWIENDRMLQIPDERMDTKKWKKIKEGGWECRPGWAYSGWDPYQNIPTTTQRGVEFIHAQAKTVQPFFLYFAFPSPHAPIIPNDKFDGTSKAGPYGDFVVETDDSVGQLLRALEESGQADNTLVIFSADNGPEKYAYKRDEKFDHWSAYPLRGLKRDIYEGGHHVPFVIKYPGVAQAGAVNSALVSQIDLMATLAEVVGAELPAENAAEDSISLVPLLTGQSKSVRIKHVHNTRKDQYAIRVGDWLLIAHKHGYMSGRNKAWEAKHGYAPDDDSPYELYNLKRDLGQRKNLAGERPEIVERLLAELKAMREQPSSIHQSRG